MAAASDLASFDDRLAFLVSKLPAEEILKIALHGVRISAATRRFAAERHAEIRPLPSWCVSDVLLSSDPLHKLFSSLSLRDGGRASGVCSAWIAAWKAIRQGRSPVHAETLGPALPWVEAGSEPLVLDRPHGLAVLPSGAVLVLCVRYRIFHCTPDFKVIGNIIRHGDLEFGHVGGLACDARTVFVVAANFLVSFDASNLAPLRQSAADDHYGTPAISADNVYVRTRGRTIAVYDKANLVEHSRFGEGKLRSFGEMAILGEQLYVSDDDDDGKPHARVHIFSLQGEHRRTVDLDDVWNIRGLAAANGRLFATELVALPYDIDDEDEAERAHADMGKRVLTLSPQLEVLHEFRGEGVPGEHDFLGMAPRGDNELLVTNFVARKIDVLSV